MGVARSFEIVDAAATSLRRPPLTPPHRACARARASAARVWKGERRSVLATRSAPELCIRHQQELSPRVIFVRLLRRWRPVWSRSARARKKTPSPRWGEGWGEGFERLGRSSRLTPPHPRSLHSLYLSPPGRGDRNRKRKRNAERRRVQPPHLAVRRCSCGSSTPLGVPPRFSPKGLFVPKAQLRPGFVGGSAQRRVAPASAAPTSSDAPRTPVIVPAGMMPEPPECEGDEPNARGHRTRSANCSQQPASFTGANCYSACNRNSD